MLFARRNRDWSTQINGLDWRLRLALSPLQFPLYSLTQQVRPFLTLVKNGIHARQRPGWEPGWHLFLVDSLPAHLGGNS